MKKTELRKPSAENPLAEWSAPEQQVATPTYQNPNEMQSLWQPVELQLPLPMPLLNGGFLALALGSGIASNRIVLVFSMISQLIASGIGVFGFGFGFVSGDGSHVMPNAYYAIYADASGDGDAAAVRIQLPKPLMLDASWPTAHRAGKSMCCFYNFNWSSCARSQHRDPSIGPRRARNFWQFPKQILLERICFGMHEVVASYSGDRPSEPPTKIV